MKGLVPTIVFACSYNISGGINHLNRACTSHISILIQDLRLVRGAIPILDSIRYDRAQVEPDDVVRISHLKDDKYI